MMMMIDYLIRCDLTLSCSCGCRANCSDKEVSAEEEQQVDELFSILSGQVQMTPRQVGRYLVMILCYHD